MLVIDPRKCSGCRRCETHCAFYHSGKTGRLGARIKVEKMETIGIDFPVVCRQCAEIGRASCRERVCHRV